MHILNSFGYWKLTYQMFSLKQRKKEKKNEENEE